MAETGIGGSDESFISFAFAITSVLLIVLYIPWIIGGIRETCLYYGATKKSQTTMHNPLEEIVASLLYLPRMALQLLRDPALLTAGANVCWREKTFFLRCVSPKFIKFVIRPRILVLWLWLVLFSSAMYASLTFDPHHILGVAHDATTMDIKKAYRGMSKRFHPDHNKTDGARDVYVQVRRAYKALVDREAFDEEEAKTMQEYTVGVALPRFLTSREHDGLVLFGLLALLFIIPWLLWYKFGSREKMATLLWRIRFDKERVANFMRHFGIPEDVKFAERRTSRRMMLGVFVQLGILPRDTPDEVFRSFPTFPDFMQRCVEVDKHMHYLKTLGLSVDQIGMLHQHYSANGVQLLDSYEKELEKVEAESSTSSAVPLISPSAYKATRYLFQQHTIQVNQALVELQEMMGSNLTSAKKLLNLHEEMYDLLDTVYSKSDKPSKQLIAKLSAMPARVSDIIDSMSPEIETLYRRVYKKYLSQVQQMPQQQQQQRR